MARNVPNTQPPNITGGLLLEELADLLDLGPPGAGVEQQVAQFAGIRLHVDGSPGGGREALQDEDLVLGSAFLLDGVHRSDTPVTATERSRAERCCPTNS